MLNPVRMFSSPAWPLTGCAILHSDLSRLRLGSLAYKTGITLVAGRVKQCSEYEAGSAYARSPSRLHKSAVPVDSPLAPQTKTGFYLEQEQWKRGREGQQS